MSVRPVVRVITAHQQTEGGGFVVRRPFPTRGLDHLDPLLMLDELGPVTYAPGEAIGAPDHPHRGFETVTYVLQGESEHADSAGHAGTLRPGDVQWMTAGSGVVHREMPSVAIQRDGGTMHGFQLWVNLPSSEKGVAPRYQEIAGSTLPTVQTDDGRATVRILAGEALGTSAVVRTRTPVLYHHWTFAEGADVTLPVPEDHNIGVYVFEGFLSVDGTTVSAGQLALLGAGGSIAMRASGRAQALVLGGRPLGEPIAWGGPFVMNTREEVLQAYADCQAGRMGSIPPEIVRA
ncbi:MAG: pirin family protein [Myxococcota bacterium]